MKIENLDFRLWNEHTKSYQPIEELHFDNGKILDAFDGVYYYDITDDHVVVEMWSGSRDKHNRKIYEGDILLSRRGHMYIVVFWSCGFWLEPVHNIPQHDEDGLQLVHAQNSTGEVIGNIHENRNIIMEEI